MDIVWHGPVFERSGYASLARSAVHGLRRRGANVTLAEARVDADVFADAIVEPDDLAIWNDALSTGSRLDGGKRTLLVSCQTPIGSDGHDAFARSTRVFPGAAHHVGLTMFETDRLPRAWVSACNRVDRVWVPSTFNREVFVDSGVDERRIEVVHPGVASARLDPHVHAAAERSAGAAASTVFLSIFKWEWRKGWDVLLRAYLRAFRASDETLLIIRSSRYPERGPSIRERVLGFLAAEGGATAGRPRILVIEHRLSSIELANLYGCADAFVLPSRGEGLGLPYLEAMAVGLPVIGTAWSGSQDFLTADNSFPIGIDGLEPVGHHAYAGSSYEPTMKWASPSVDDTVLQMRRVHGDHTAAMAKGRLARADVGEFWTADHAADRYVDAARRALASYGTPRRRRPPVNAADSPIRITGSLYGVSSHSGEARALLHAMHEAGTAPAAKHIRSELDDASVDPATQDQIEGCLARPTAEHWIDIQHMPVSALQGERSAPVTVARTSAPLEGVDRTSRDLCRTFDELWVPSPTHRERFIMAGADPSRVVVMPVGVEERFRGRPSRDWDRSAVFGFLCAVDSTALRYLDVLIDAFALTFSTNDDVELRIKVRPCWAGPSCEQNIHDRLGRLGLSYRAQRRLVARITVDASPIPDRLMPNLYRTADAYVDLSGGAGLGQGVLEAAAADLAVVAFGGDNRRELVDDTTATQVRFAAVSSSSKPDHRAEVDAARVALTTVGDDHSVVTQRREAMRRRIDGLPNTRVVAERMLARSRQLLVKL